MTNNTPTHAVVYANGTEALHYGDAITAERMAEFLRSGFGRDRDRDAAVIAL